MVHMVIMFDGTISYYTFRMLFMLGTSKSSHTHTRYAQRTNSGTERVEYVVYSMHMRTIRFTIYPVKHTHTQPRRQNILCAHSKLSACFRAQWWKIGIVMKRVRLCVCVCECVRLCLLEKSIRAYFEGIICSCVCVCRVRTHDQVDARNTEFVEKSKLIQIARVCPYQTPPPFHPIARTTTDISHL